jgi:peptidoglycan/xylan/chitin deacetylase (PgdA/CDA1 family)
MRYKLERFIARNSQKKALTLPVSTPVVSMTFDDMDVSGFTTGAGLMEEFGARATFYANGSLSNVYSGTPVHFEFQDLHSLYKAGHEIACHGFAHSDYQRVPAGEVEKDIALNRKFIVDHRLPAPRNFAYPFGNLNTRVKRQALSHFDSCRGVTGGINRSIADLGYLKAVPLYKASISLDQINMMLDSLVRFGGWLIFFTHGVRDNPGRYDTTSAQLAATLTQVSARKIPLLTTAASLAHLGFPGARNPEKKV